MDAFSISKNVMKIREVLKNGKSWKTTKVSFKNGTYKIEK